MGSVQLTCKLAETAHCTANAEADKGKIENQVQRTARA